MYLCNVHLQSHERVDTSVARYSLVSYPDEKEKIGENLSRHIYWQELMNHFAEFLYVSEHAVSFTDQRPSSLV